MSIARIRSNLPLLPVRTTCRSSRKRVRLAALKELRLDQTGCTSGLLDHLILPSCTELMLKGQFTGETLDQHGFPVARIHPSSIDHISVTRGVTKAVAMPNSCILSGPNGDLRLLFPDGTRGDFGAGFFTSFSPISVLDIRELWVGGETSSGQPWKPASADIRGAFGVLTKVEDLTIVGCDTTQFSTALGVNITTDSGILLPELRRLTIYIGSGDLDVHALVLCVKARKENSRPLLEVTLVWQRKATTESIQEAELLRGFVAEVNHRVGVALDLSWMGIDCVE